MTYAALKNADDSYILPSLDSIGAAVHNGTIIANNSILPNVTSEKDLSKKMEAIVTPPTIDVGRLGNSSYPIVGFYYAIFPKNNTVNTPALNSTNIDEEKKGSAIDDILRWCVSGSEGKQILKDVQYPSIYERNKILAALIDQLLENFRSPDLPQGKTTSSLSLPRSPSSS
jgi:hypothetical protein